MILSLNLQQLNQKIFLLKAMIFFVEFPVKSHNLYCLSFFLRLEKMSLVNSGTFVHSLLGLSSR